MNVERFIIQRAESLNNFQPGGKEYWIVYLHSDQSKPLLFEKLENAFKWINDLMHPLEFRSAKDMESKYDF